MSDMKSSEIKKLIISSLENETNDGKITSELQEKLSYDFSQDFGDKVLDRIFGEGAVAVSQYEFNRYLNIAFYRIALSAAAAIVILMISIFLKEGSLSFDSLLGMGDGYSESIVCLLTGN
jgi:hypothetical protein